MHCKNTDIDIFLAAVSWWWAGGQHLAAGSAPQMALVSPVDTQAVSDPAGLPASEGAEV